jgi:MarR family transcriptional regulator for hemolysin
LVADDADLSAEGAEFDRWAVNHGDYYPPGSRLDLEFRLSRNLVMAGRRWVTLIDGLVKAKHGQSRARWQTMFSIAFAGRPVTTIALAKRLGVQWPTLIRVLDELEREGLVIRRDNPDDRRSRWIELSPAGHEVTRRVQTVLDPARSEMLAGLSDEEMAIGVRLLGRILAGTRTWREVMADGDGADAAADAAACSDE